MLAINKLMVLAALSAATLCVQPHDKDKKNAGHAFSSNAMESAARTSAHITRDVVPAPQPVATLPAARRSTCENDTNDTKRGLALLRDSDCATCHTKTLKLIGPSYSDIAKRYRPDHSSVNRLADRVIKGGGGAWGKVPMTPHNKLTRRDAKLIVRYILTLID